MISRNKVILIFLFFSIFIILVSFGDQKTEWKGKIEYENGVKVIKKPVLVRILLLHYIE
jgi:hypothetical protein